MPVAAGIGKEVKALTPTSPVYQMLHPIVPGGIQALDRVLGDFKSHPASSLDDFLFYRQQQPLTMRVGKLLIAALLGKAIAGQPKARAKTADQDWIRHVLDYMRVGAPTPEAFASGANNVAFVTFNFDSVIEEVAADFIPRVYDGHEGVQQAVEAVHVIHVHGRLESPPSVPLEASALSHGYTNSGISLKWIDWTQRSAEGIRIVVDDIEQEVLDDVQLKIRKARMLCFLGFSYDQNNLAKLGIPAQLKADTYKTTFGTAYELAGAKREEIFLTFNREITLSAVDKHCAHILQDHHVMRG